MLLIVELTLRTLPSITSRISLFSKASISSSIPSIFSGTLDQYEETDSFLSCDWIES